MIQAISAPISVTFDFDHKQRRVRPTRLAWEGREYMVSQVGLHHSYWKGKVFYHIFSVKAGNIFFRLALNTQTLFWTLEQLADGEPA